MNQTRATIAASIRQDILLLVAQRMATCIVLESHSACTGNQRAQAVPMISTTKVKRVATVMEWVLLHPTVQSSALPANLLQ